MFVIKYFNKAADTTSKCVINTVVGYSISNASICIQEVSLKVSLRDQENRKILLAAIVVKVNTTKLVGKLLYNQNMDSTYLSEVKRVANKNPVIKPQN